MPPGTLPAKNAFRLPEAPWSLMSLEKEGYYFCRMSLAGPGEKLSSFMLAGLRKFAAATGGYN
jgi:hypothetical protein